MGGGRYDMIGGRGGEKGEERVLLQGDGSSCGLCPLSGQPATVEVEVDGADEGKQTQQGQSDVHLRDREKKN